MPVGVCNQTHVATADIARKDYVDKFQGQENQVAVISMVRSNKKSDYQEAIGFVNESRSCVAFSRSKRKTIIVGDRDTLIRNRFLLRISLFLYI